ncbi:MAG: hypothetical protein KA052_02465 [Candidatus Pacebacteria bacterium]|nr:hypothetical protein [Candidatus Paceibacterota bacterium]
MRKHEHGEPAFPTQETRDNNFENAKQFQGKVESGTMNAAKELEGYNELVNAGWIKKEHKEAVKESQERVQKSGKRFGKYLLLAAVPVIMLAFKSSKFSEQASAMSTDDKDKLEFVKQGTPPIVYTEDSTENETPAKVAPVATPKSANYAEAVKTTSTEASHTGSVKEFADKALRMKGNLKDCSGFTETYAELFGHPELKGMLANEQVAYMKGHWHVVDAQTAKKMAEAGHLVIAGLKEKGHGHTIAVVGGSGETKDGIFYPNVEGGGMSRGGRSDGSKTAGDVFKAKNRAQVQYFTPDQM